MNRSLKFLWPFCILIGCEKPSRDFWTNHSVGSRLWQLKELSGNSRVDGTPSYSVELSCAQETSEKGVGMNRKLRAALKVLENVSSKCPVTRELIAQNMKWVWERESSTVEEVVHFTFSCLDDGYLYLMFACLWGSGWVGGLLFHALTVLL